ncbi:MAG: hypothetical protein JNL74_07950, partial [Fibrobacteres bacterium]|nr:hypothetical protein [Fibrobacterota bacterium]
MKKRLVFALFALFSAGFGIGITETDSRSSFVWSASWAAPSVSAAVTKDGNWSNISIPEFIHYDEKRGVPQIPAYSFSIGIPEGDIKLNWNFSDPVAIKIANPVAPVPVMLKTTIPQYLMDSSAYNRNLAATVDTLITYVGNQRILKISVNPVSYSFTSSSISFYRGVRITVGFSPKGARTASPGFESMLSSMILNYSTARDFRVVKPVAKMATAKAASQFTAARTFRLKLRNLSSHGTEGEGMYRVTYEQLASEASFNSARIDDIRLFAPSQIVLRQQYSTGVEDSLALRQVPTEIIDRDGDGYFESGDEIRFYGRADTRFRVENTTSIKYERNPFDTAAYYWLAINSQTADSRLKIDTVSVASSSQRKSVSKGYVIIHREFDNFNPSMDAYKDGEDYTIGWLWQNITTPCVDAINYNLMPDDSTGEIYCTSGLYGNMQVMFNGDSAVSLGSSVYRINNLSSTAANTVSIRFRGSGNENLDFYQLRYQRKLVLQGKQQIFFGQKGTDTLFDYKLFAGSTDSFAAYDVSDEYMPIKKKLSRNGDTLQFSSLGRSVSSGGRFVVLPSTAGWKSPEIIELVDTLYSSPFQVRNLRNSMLSKDYVIITHPKFATQAIKLAVHRKGFVNDSINNPAVVLVGDVYNHFSGGTVDPAAVRNFIMYANKYWGTHTVVLFGAGYRKYRVADGAPLVPTYLPFDGIETSRQTSLSGSFSTCTDDFFMNGNGWKVKVGRFPVATESEAEALVDKTIGFDLAAEDQKNWRNRMLLTADDDMQLSAPDEIITGSYYHH